jgi:hypothetical protein
LLDFVDLLCDQPAPFVENLVKILVIQDEVAKIGEGTLAYLER